MCGIFCYATKGNGSLGNDQIFSSGLLDDIRSTIQSRGLDFFGELEISADAYKMSMGAAILHMQGITLAQQPVDTNVGILLWNGEVFDGDISISQGESDTGAIVQILDSLPDSPHFLDDLHVGLLSKIEGPYSFIYYRKSTQMLYYCRDVFGRRSLLQSLDSDTFILCSSIVSKNIQLEEVSVNSIYEMDLASFTTKEYIRQSPFPSSPLTTIFPVSYYDQKCLFLLENAVKTRISFNAINTFTIAVLFSGGLDSTILAVLVDRLLPLNAGIELINVSFATASSDTSQNTPDRLSALESMSELRKLSPLRNWIFSTVDVSMDLYQQNRSRILSLISPSNTAMDLSIAAPFWFAATWPSKSRILLVGFGADELFGGYSRYRARYSHGGMDSVSSEVKLDLNRMWYRNLGRDDRVLSDGGREARYPFLDEKVVKFVLGECPVSTRMDFSLSRGMGEKAMLRRIASTLGLNYCVTLPKRAVQFGTRSSKMEGPSIKSGKDLVCQ